MLGDWWSRTWKWWWSWWLETPSRRGLGARGEREAERFLRRRGYRIVARGARDRLGEIDLIAIDQGTIVFVEVKTRTSHAMGHPGEAVDLRKQRQLTRVALAFLKRHDLLEYPARFDVIAITWPEDQAEPQIEHIRNAFEPPGKWQMFA